MRPALPSYLGHISAVATSLPRHARVFSLAPLRLPFPTPLPPARFNVSFSAKMSLHTETAPGDAASSASTSGTTSQLASASSARRASIEGEAPLKKQRLQPPQTEEPASFCGPAAEAEAAESGDSKVSARNPPTDKEPPLPNGAKFKKELPPELQSSYDPANFPAELPKSTSVVNYRHGLFLAPMVRIGSLPTRLLSLEYGADLVWGPEIVDRAIMGANRIVDEKTGAVHFVKDGKSVFTTHAIERPYVIFQLGCATPAWAYEAVKLVTANDDVAGVDLNCGCPKNFSTTGGMGAGLLPRPDLLCDILRAMRRAAPPHVAVTCKLRLLPTMEATKDLVRKICRTGAVDAITIHCRTKEMRPREPALLHRISEVVDTVREETNGRIPVCHNGDSWNWHDAQKIMKDGNVTSSMLARGPEKNPSYFSPEPPASIADVIVPKWLKYALAFDNHIGNTKYCLNSLEWNTQSPGLARHTIIKIKEAASRAKTNEAICETDYYRGKVDPAKCKSELDTYVLGDLRKVLDERQARRHGEVGKQTLEGVAGKVEENERQEAEAEADVNGNGTVAPATAGGQPAEKAGADAAAAAAATAA